MWREITRVAIITGARCSELHDILLFTYDLRQTVHMHVPNRPFSYPYSEFSAICWGCIQSFDYTGRNLNFYFLYQKEAVFTFSEN